MSKLQNFILKMSQVGNWKPQVWTRMLASSIKQIDNDLFYLLFLKNKLPQKYINARNVRLSIFQETIEFFYTNSCKIPTCTSKAA